MDGCLCPECIRAALAGHMAEQVDRLYAEERSGVEEMERMLGRHRTVYTSARNFARARAMLAAGREDDVAAQAAAEVAPVPVDAMPTRPRSFAQWQREAADLLARASRQRR